MGPVLVSPRALPDPSVVRLQTHLNGEIMQDRFASSMIFSIAQYVLHFVLVADKKDHRLHVSRYHLASWDDHHYGYPIWDWEWKITPSLAQEWGSSQLFDLAWDWDFDQCHRVRVCR